MEEKQITRYQCEICYQLYDSKEDALECESKPISQDKGAKLGDEIVITKGDGAGQRGIVTSRFIYDKHWGPYAWKRYWHTIGLCADIIDSWGSRQLTFDDYELLNA